MSAEIVQNVNREEIIAAVRKHRLIAIARGLTEEELTAAAEAMYAGGVRLLEITYNACGEPSDAATAAQIGMLARLFAGRMYIGAGTVLTVEQVTLTKEAGGQFIISPDANREVVEKTRELGLVSIPGCMTPSEATAATRWGADFIKMFPTSEFKPSFFKAVTVPLSHISFLAVGGISLDNVREYLAAGVAGIGMGNGIVDKKLIHAGKYDEITALAKAYTDILEVR